MAIGCWFTWFQDPIYTLQYVKYKNNGINGTGFEHPNYIRLLDLADMEEDSAVRGMYLQQAESFIMNELPLIPLFSLTNNYANAPGVTGETFSSVGLVELKWIEKSRLGHLGLDCRLSAQRQSGNVKS